MVKAKVGMRVHVFSADGTDTELGMGTIKKVQPLYFEDTEIILTKHYPSRIELDSGRVTEGCKCWWVSDKQHRQALAEHRKETMRT